MLQSCSTIFKNRPTLSRQNGKQTERCITLNDAAVAESISETTDIEVEESENETDSAYQSLESDEGNLRKLDHSLEAPGNLPKLYDLMKPDFCEHYRGINTGTHSEIYTFRTTENSIVSLEDAYKPITSLKDRSKYKQNSLEIHKNSVVCSKHLEAENDDPGKTKVDDELHVTIESNVSFDVQKENKRNAHHVANTYINDIDNTTELEYENSDEDLLQAIVGCDDVDCAEIVIHDTDDAEQEPTLIYPYIDNYMDLENFDTNVGKAYEESVESESLSPLIKEELKCLIQCRRLQDGKPELFVVPEEPKQYKLRDDEIRKKVARLEQNRRSARKIRHRSRENEAVLLKYIHDAEQAHRKLTEEAYQLRKERDLVATQLKEHLIVCGKVKFVATSQKLKKYLCSNF